MLTNCLAACAHLTITVSETERDIGRKLAFFSYRYPLAFDAPVRGLPVWISPPCFVRKNYNGAATRWWKNFEDIFIRFDATHERDRRTDTVWRQRLRLCIASCGKNGWQVGHITSKPLFWQNKCSQLSQATMNVASPSGNVSCMIRFYHHSFAVRHAMLS